MRELGIVDDSRVVLASRGATPGPHPVAPCLVLEAQTVSPESTLHRLTRDGQRLAYAHRALSFTVTGYGDACFNWLEALRLNVDTTPDAFTLTPDGDVFDVSEVLSSGIEQVWACSFNARFVISRGRPAVEATQTVITINGSN